MSQRLHIGMPLNEEIYRL